MQRKKKKRCDRTEAKEHKRAEIRPAGATGGGEMKSKVGKAGSSVDSGLKFKLEPVFYLNTASYKRRYIA